MNKNIYNYANYLGKQVNNNFLKNNKLYEDIYNYSKSGKLVIEKEGYKHFKHSKTDKLGVTLDDIIAYTLAKSISKSMPSHLIPKYKRQLINLYYLSSSLCYVQTVSKNASISLITTKSKETMDKFAFKLADSEKSKQVADYMKQLTISPEEIRKGYANTISLSLDVGGYYIAKKFINIGDPNTIVIPKAFLDNAVEAFLNMLRKGSYSITYKNRDGIMRHAEVSLNEQIVGMWLHTKDINRIRKVIGSVRNIYDCNLLRLPSVRRSVYVNYLDILSVVPNVRK